jgi:hypothetical protein
MKELYTVHSKLCLITFCSDLMSVYLMICPKRGLLKLFERAVVEISRMSAHSVYM